MSGGKSPAQEVKDLADQLGRPMPKAEYVEFMEDLASTFQIQADATQEEIDNEEEGDEM